MLKHYQYAFQSQNSEEQIQDYIKSYSQYLKKPFKNQHEYISLCDVGFKKIDEEYFRNECIIQRSSCLHELVKELTEIEKIWSDNGVLSEINSFHDSNKPLYRAAIAKIIKKLSVDRATVHFINTALYFKADNTELLAFVKSLLNQVKKYYI